MPRCGRNQERSSDQKPSAVLTWTEGLTAPLRVGGHQRVATLTQMKQDCAALEDGGVPVGQPRHLTERLVREMLGAPCAEGHALDAVRQRSLFQRPTDTQVAHIAAR